MRPILTRALGEDVAAHTLDRLEHGVSTVHHRQNEIIYHQGSVADGIYVVGHGCVLLEWMAPNGFVAAFRLASGGECFGHRSFCGSEPRSTVARSVTPSLTFHVPGRILDAAMADDPGLIRALARLLARDSGPKISKIARNGRMPVRIRLAYVLHELTQRLPGSTDHDGDYFEFPLTQKDLSNLLDVSQETISRTLHELESEGLLSLRHGPRRLLVADRAALVELAGSSD